LAIKNSRVTTNATRRMDSMETIMPDQQISNGASRTNNERTLWRARRDSNPNLLIRRSPWRGRGRSTGLQKSCVCAYQVPSDINEIQVVSVGLLTKALTGYFNSDLANEFRPLSLRTRGQIGRLSTGRPPNMPKQFLSTSHRKVF
jgi:hypothetical protein